MSCAPIRLAEPWSLICWPSAVSPHTRQRNFAPRPTFGGSGAVPLPVLTSKRTVFRFASTMGSTHAFLLGLVESQKECTSGICAPQAGFGHFTVRAQSHAITVASPPPYSFGSLTLG